MKLALMLFQYFPFGGLQRDCLKVAQRCAARGHDVTIFTREWQSDRPTGLRVELLESRGWSNIARDRAFARNVAHALAAGSFDGVIGFNKLPGLDVYYGADPCYVAKVNRLKPAWYHWTPRYRHFAAMEEAVFAHGRRTHALVLTEEEIPRYEEVYGTEWERFHVLPPGIERRTFTAEQKTNARTRFRREHGWSAEEQLLLLVGSGFRVKGLDRAIQSLASLPRETLARTRLVVIGQSHPAEFASQAKRLGVGDRLHFLGGRNDVFDWMLAADLLVHPARSESAGMILLEALTAGLPVLATDACGYAFHIQNAEAGRVLASPFGQKHCDADVREMLTSPERSAWSANGVNYAAREDLYSCHERAVEWIEKLLAQKHAGKSNTPV
jgi:UDP-glucose:(heptosyl)LPS alpha-1,3-glucosyltransferase